ncbi:MAG: SDR family oxidoreductase [Gemmatimonadota bacterium]|jgi:NAD(P)-dependent dehydrogenase (short-subunit alcohol dehydrogenase family)|nr:SDR family oxidoreductase [Gemmatimonadota bacterium]
MDPNSIVLVTGGAGNLGQAVTRVLLESGLRVAVPFYKTDAADALDALKPEWGERLFTFALDLTTERGARAAVEQTVEWGGRLDALCHLIGGYRGGSRVADTPMEVWDRMIDLNLRSAWLIARAALPEMVARGRGRLVFVGSRAVFHGRAGNAAYSVSKAGLGTLAAAIAEEYGTDGIRANLILPGTVDTADNRAAMPDADHSRWTPPEQIARVIHFLVSDASAPINGAAVPVHGRG